jgi:hypothetical protein
MLAKLVSSYNVIQCVKTGAKSGWPLSPANMSVSIGVMLKICAAYIGGEAAIGPVNSDISIPGLNIGYPFEL